mgnify:CR=1 FL=1
MHGPRRRYRRHLNRIAELNYGNARRNPLAQTRAWRFEPGAFSDDDELNPPIEGSLRKADCGQVTDGAAAVFLASTTHDEAQPAHLKVADTSVCATKCVVPVASPRRRHRAPRSGWGRRWGSPRARSPG